MYSLPITTYSDYWRATKVWSSYLGGLALFTAGTRYSTLGPQDITQTLQLPIQLATQPSNTGELGSKLSSLDFRQRAYSQGTLSRGIPIQVSRGASSQSTANREAANREANDREADGQETASQEVGDWVTSRTQVEEKEIPFDTLYIESDKLLPGMSQIQEEGEKGLVRQVVKTFEVGGQPIDQQVQSSFELKSPKKKVIIKNSKPVVGEDFELDKMRISQTLKVESTAYTYTGNRTATGLVSREGLIAVDPRVIAMGSKVYVEGYGYAIAADTGGDIRGNRIDVFFSTLRQCIDWGRRPVRIYVLKPI
ncbi:3D domain-containing protein [Desulfosporosinus sp. BG]|uniref:G5 and 3D domain-containing protein n=1 Tax=Desulfosporosinus sp. BG TaxID=1633135 RepID=UPI00083A4E4A|nr:3D domain-containing protein [Desulfosporosinus sp. BG]ODA41567.1 Cell wall-binding protein [Desulfosporosinus sp. BG]